MNPVAIHPTSHTTINTHQTITPTTTNSQLPCIDWPSPRGRYHSATDMDLTVVDQGHIPTPASGGPGPFKADHHLSPLSPSHCPPLLFLFPISANSCPCHLCKPTPNPSLCRHLPVLVSGTSSVSPT